MMTTAKLLFHCPDKPGILAEVVPIKSYRETTELIHGDM